MRCVLIEALTHRSSKYLNFLQEYFVLHFHEETTGESTSEKHFSLLSNPVKVYYSSVIKDRKIPVVFLVEALSSGWQNGHVTYTFTSQYSSKPDDLSDAFRGELNLVDSNAEESDTDSDSDDGGQQSEVELTALALLHRRRVVRNVVGQVLTSYRDLLNPPPARQRQSPLALWGHMETNGCRKKLLRV